MNGAGRVGGARAASAVVFLWLIAVAVGEGYSQAAAPATPAHDYSNARLDSVDADFRNAVFTDCPWDNARNSAACGGAAIAVGVPEKLRPELKQFSAGDQLRVAINPKNELTEVDGAAFYPNPDHSGEKPIGFWRIFLALAVPALLLIGLAALFTGFQPFDFVLGQDGKYSNSKFQVVLWFWIVISSYAAVFFFRVLYAGWDFVGGVGIPQNLLVLSGLSALTYGGAKAITTAKSNAADAAAEKAKQEAAMATAEHSAASALGAGVQMAKTKMEVAVSVAEALKDKAALKKRDPADKPNLLMDLVTNDLGGLDFGDFQMVVVTLIAVGTYLVLIFHFLHAVEFRKSVSLPDVDSTVLALFGIGQGAYLAKKAGGDLGKS